MRIKFQIVGDTLYLFLIGELDEHYAKGVKEFIDEKVDQQKNLKNVIFNMQELSFMDSTGIGILLGRYKKCKKSGLNIYIENPSLAVDKVLSLSGIYEIMPKI
ncbi:MAG: anti-sigma factor antagonist [Christensenellaceae bacterium]